MLLWTAVPEIFIWLLSSKVWWYSGVTTFYKLLIVFRKKGNWTACTCQFIIWEAAWLLHLTAASRTVKLCLISLLPIRGCARQSTSYNRYHGVPTGPALPRIPIVVRLPIIPTSHLLEGKNMQGEQPELLTPTTDTQPEQRAAIKVSVLGPRAHDNRLQLVSSPSSSKKRWWLVLWLPDGGLTACEPSSHPADCLTPHKTKGPSPALPVPLQEDAEPFQPQSWSHLYHCGFNCARNSRPALEAGAG